MTKYQLIYNGNPAYPLLKTRKKAENFKQKAAKQWPNVSVVIVEVSADEVAK